MGKTNSEPSFAICKGPALTKPKRLLFFPSPYPDELLYSVFARYHHWSVNASPESTSRDLFGRGVYAAMELPSHLNYLYNCLDEKTKLTTKSLIMNNTLFPLYQSFLPRERAERLRRHMLEYNRGAYVPRSAGTYLYTSRAGFFLKRCNSCNQNYYRKYGEMSWIRSHQAFGVQICHIHHEWLEACTDDIRLQRDRKRYMRPEETTFDGASLLLRSQSEFNQHLWIAESVAWLLRTPVSIVTSHDYVRRFAYHLRRRGYTSLSAQIHMKQLVADMRRDLCDNFLVEMASPLTSEMSETWLADLVHKPKKMVHPIRHLLLMHFLGIRPAEFWSMEIRESHPFGQDPWPCLNPACHHYKQDVINECIIVRSHKTKGPIGQFSCSCGFIYSRVGPDLNAEDRFKKSCVLAYGDVWLKKLKKLYLDEKVSLRNIGKTMNVCHHTVKKHLEDARITMAPRDLSDSRRSQKELMKRLYRRTVQKYLEDNPLSKRTDVRQNCGKEYAWLDRNDFDWLMNALPSSSISSQNFRNKVDWAKRDENLRCQIAESIKDILEDYDKQRRVTRKEILSQIGIPHLTSAQLRKMPQTKAAIQQCIKLIRQFQRNMLEELCGISVPKRSYSQLSLFL